MFTLVGDSDESNVVVFVPGEEPLVAHSSHPNFNAIVAGARDGDESIVDLFDIAQAVSQKFDRLSERISTANGKLYLDGEPMSGAVVDHILRSMEAGLVDFMPLVRFIENLATNPNQLSVEQLYDWMQAGSFVIDTDGMIRGYKGVKRNADGSLVSVNRGRAIVDGEEKSGAIPNYIGATVEMPRGEVTFDSAVGCSTGLHVGTYSYASGWAQGALLEVRVNPRDVVSVPTDCSAQKMRVCRYEVIGTIDQAYDVPVIGAEFDPEDDLYADYDVWGDGEDDFDYLDEFGW